MLSQLRSTFACLQCLVQDYFELGVILTRKRLFTQATKNLEKAKKVWDGEESELAQVGGTAQQHQTAHVHIGVPCM